METAPAASTWDAYETAYRTLRFSIRAFMDALADEFDAEAYEDTSQDDYGYACRLTCNGITYFADLRLIDASGAGDEVEPGRSGNLFLSVIRDGGQIVIGWAPENYSDQCWVPYTDLQTLQDRVPDLDEAENVAAAVQRDAYNVDDSAPTTAIPDAAHEPATVIPTAPLAAARPLSPSAFWLAAASWGSYMSSGDPGACMYGFDEHGTVQSEDHRADCIAWITDHCRSAADCNDDPEADHAELDAMLAYLKTAPTYAAAKES